MPRDHRYGASASSGMPVYARTFAGNKPYCNKRHMDLNNFAQADYSTAQQPGLKLMTTESLVRCLIH